MRLRLATTRRSGATLVEFAIVLPVFLTLILGMIDVGMAVFQAHVLSETARQAARRAVVHGYLAGQDYANNGKGLKMWGPTTYGPVALTDSGAIATEIKPYVSGLIDPSQVKITVKWLDGDNKENNQVRVTLTYTHRPITTYVIGAGILLSASSTMTISH